MPQKSLMERFKATGAILEGHFLLSSGLHSNRYIQCAKLLQHPHHASWCGEQLVELLPDEEFDIVVSPAVGGIVIGQEIARILDIRHIFVEKEDGVPTLRRGFRIFEGDAALVVEDVVTTGKSSLEVMDVIRAAGGEVVASCAIVDRGGGKKLGVPFVALTELEIEVFEPENCPLCAEGKPFIKPGSRHIEEEKEEIEEDE